MVGGKPMGRAALLSKASDGEITRPPTATGSREATSALVEAYLAAAGPSSAAPARVPGAVTRTEHGYSFVDLTRWEFVQPAMRAYLASKSELALPLLGATLRRHDNDRDGCVDIFEFRAAMADAGAPLSASDAETVYRVFGAQLLGLPQSRINVDTDRLPLERMHALLRKGVSRFPCCAHILAHCRHTLPSAGLEGARRSVVLSAFTALDKEGTGAVPIGVAMLAFNADAYPPVATGEGLVGALGRLSNDTTAPLPRHDFAVAVIGIVARVRRQGGVARRVQAVPGRVWGGLRTGGRQWAHRPQCWVGQARRAGILRPG